MRICSMVIVTKFDQNRLNGSWDMLCWQKEKEERKKELEMLCPLQGHELS